MIKTSQKVKTIITVLMVLVAIGYGLFVHRDLQTETLVSVDMDVVFSGNQNDSSLYNEVWIYNFLIDGETVPATEFGIPEGWEEYAGYLHAYGDPLTKEPLHISIPECKNASICFATSNSSGVVLLKTGTEEKSVDLYSEQNSEITQSISSYTSSLSDNQEISVVLIFLIAAIILFLLHVDLKWLGKMNLRVVGFVLVAGMVLGFFGISGQRFDTYNYDTTIRILDTKNELSTGYTAAIEWVYANDQVLSAADFDNSMSGWTQYENIVYTTGEDPSAIHIKGKNLRSVMLNIQKGNAHGILELQTGDSIQTIDMYAEQSDYQVIPLEPVGRYEPDLIINGLWAVIGALFAVIALVIIRQKNYFIGMFPPILCYLLLVQAKFLLFSWKKNAAWILLSVIVGLLIGYAADKSIAWKERTRKEKIAILFLGIYFAFAFIAQPVLLEMYTVNASISAIAFFAVMCCFGLCFSSSIVILFRLLEQRICKKTYIYHKHCYWIVFVAMSVVYAVSFLMLVPVVTSDDTRAINMAMGEIPYNDLYPYYRMLYLKLLTIIDPTQHLFALIQVGLFIAVCSAWFSKIHRKGLSLPVTIVAAMAFSLYPPNFINQMTSVRDYMCATAILFIGYVISEYLERQDMCWKLPTCIALFLSFFVLMFFRSNGFLAGILILIAFTIVVLRYKWKMKQGIAVLAIISVLIGTAQAALPYLTRGAEHSSVTNQLQLLVCENYSGILASGQNLSSETTEKLRALAPDDVWESWYLPYNMKAYPNEEEAMVTEALSTGDSIKVLLESLAKAPIITIKNRLNKTNHAWDMTRVENHWAGVSIDSYQPQDIVEPNNSIFNKIFDEIFFTKWYGKILNISLTYGIYLYFMVIAIYILWKKNQIRLVSMTIPMWCYLATLLAACAWQDQRFYYHILPFSFFLTLEAILAKKHDKKENDSELQTKADVG